MLDMMHYESTGHRRERVYVPTEEDLLDPDHMEVAALVIEQYAEDNRRIREGRMREEITRLRNLLEEHGIEADK